ncbi:hypothetical protein [Salicola sp. Rm-C-2C1-2]|uniref:tetratricopeptide repeat protein n=1 Tax=Salicola sp. Rm-C-2C1-2 TaxID=3141321 RepID=UPI0032E48257
MSLLNDALRDLEKREGGDGSGQESIPEGLSAASAPASSSWRWILGVAAVLVAVAAGAGFWWWGISDSHSGRGGAVPALDPEPLIRTVSPEPGNWERQTADKADQEVAPAGSGQDGETESAQTTAALADKAENTAEADSPDDGEPSPSQPSAPDSGEAAVAEPSDSETATESTTVRELTPAEKDRRLSRELETLLADGRVAEAKEQLNQRVTQDSKMPRSRAVMARYSLERGDHGATLQWLPEQVVATSSQLRLLRARVALARKGRASALEWLEAEPPGPGTMPAYHTMMAALYQQVGDHQAAAEQWAALIETDDSNARWWAGLGIAMESRGRNERARAAYSRALSLPGLAPQLRQYIEQRLAAEQG